MIDKSLVKKRFEKSLKTYDENAVIQKIMAEKLITLFNKTDFNSVLEIGCSTGVLTKELTSKIKFNQYFANDIVPKSEEYFKQIVPNGVFISGDIEKSELPNNFDLIISNACFQWLNSFENTVENLYNKLNDGGILAFSVFGDENLKEIKSIFNIPNKFYSLEDLKKIFSKYNVIKFEEEKHQLYFDSPLDVLKHLKYTGANALQHYKMTKSKLKMFEDKYNELYKKNDKVFLTYNPVYIVLKK